MRKAPVTLSQKHAENKMSDILTILFNPFLPHTINLIACGVWFVLAGLVYLAFTESRARRDRLRKR